jgi:hypothetical protein
MYRARAQTKRGGEQENRMKFALSAAVASVAALAIAAPAQAAKGTYAGTVGTSTGVIALDVKVSKQGIVKKITFLRGDHIPSNCEVSGPVPSINFDLPTVLPVDPQTGKFGGTYTQPTYGNQSTISGRVKHKHVSGTVEVNYHYPATSQYPEENCDTGPLQFAAKLGAPDQTTHRLAP